MAAHSNIGGVHAGERGASQSRAREWALTWPPTCVKTLPVACRLGRVESTNENRYECHNRGARVLPPPAPRAWWKRPEGNARNARACAGMRVASVGRRTYTSYYVLRLTL